MLGVASGRDADEPVDHPEDTERSCRQKVRRRPDNRVGVPGEGAGVTEEL